MVGIRSVNGVSMKGLWFTTCLGKQEFPFSAFFAVLIPYSCLFHPLLACINYLKLWTFQQISGFLWRYEKNFNAFLHARTIHAWEFTVNGTGDDGLQNLAWIWSGWTPERERQRERDGKTRWVPAQGKWKGIKTWGSFAFLLLENRQQRVALALWGSPLQPPEKCRP